MEEDAKREVDALATVAGALEPLDEDARQRILDWVHNRYLKPGYDMITKERRDAALGLMDMSQAWMQAAQSIKGIHRDDLVLGVKEARRLAEEARERERQEQEAEAVDT